MSKPVHTLFLISDRTAITIENVVRTLLTQFDHLDCDRVVLPFLDTEEKMHAAVKRINRTAELDDAPPMIFSSIVDKNKRKIIKNCNAKVFDLFDLFLKPLSEALDVPTHNHVGLSHGMGNEKTYDKRVDAVNYALSYDDGSRFKGLDRAELILVGVSRCGKTPTCLYLAMQYGVQAANFPLTEDDFLHGAFPEALKEHQERLFGLTIAPDRLHRIREERRPGSQYASLNQCRTEIKAAEDLFRNYGIPYLDSTAVSIEELAVAIMQLVGVERAV